MAEIEIGVAQRQCLDRRMATQEEVERELLTWAARRNDQHYGTDWRFTAEEARIGGQGRALLPRPFTHGTAKRRAALARGGSSGLVRGSIRRDMSHSPFPTRQTDMELGLCRVEVGPLTRSQRITVRSLGQDLNRLASGVRLLSDRLRNQTLPPPLTGFLMPILTVSSRSDEEPRPPSFDLRVAFTHGRLVMPWSSMSACSESEARSALMLALFHLPALRAFWMRVLRHSRFERLRRVLPHAWFLQTAAPPVGAVVPGLGLVSRSRIPVGAEFRVIPFSSGEEEHPLLIKDAPLAVSTLGLANYERTDGLVRLTSFKTTTD